MGQVKERARGSPGEPSKGTGEKIVFFRNFNIIMGALLQSLEAVMEDWKNKLYFSDNLEVLRRHIPMAVLT